MRVAWELVRTDLQFLLLSLLLVTFNCRLVSVNCSGATMSLSGENLHTLDSTTTGANNPGNGVFVANRNGGNGNGIDPLEDADTIGDIDVSDPVGDVETAGGPVTPSVLETAAGDWDSVAEPDALKLIRQRCKSLDYYQSTLEHRSAEPEILSHFPQKFASFVDTPRVVVPPLAPGAPFPNPTSIRTPQRFREPHREIVRRQRNKSSTDQLPTTLLSRKSSSVGRLRRWVMGLLNCSDQEQQRPRPSLIGGTSDVTPKSVPGCDFPERRGDIRRLLGNRSPYLADSAKLSGGGVSSESTPVSRSVTSRPSTDRKVDQNSDSALLLPTSSTTGDGRLSTQVGYDKDSSASQLLSGRAARAASVVSSVARRPGAPSLIGSSLKSWAPKSVGSILINGRSTVYLLGLCLLLMAPSSTTATCRMKFCDYSYASALEAKKLISGANLPFCLNLDEYFRCLNSTRLPCRGNLRFHAMFTVTKRHMKKNNCSGIIAADIKAQQLSSGAESPGRVDAGRSPVDPRQGGAQVSPLGSDYNNRLIPQLNNDGGRASLSSGSDPASGSVIDLTPGVIGQPVGDIMPGRCLFPYHHQSGPSGFRHCGLFGDPHLRTFSGQQETCRTVGAWPLVDNAFLAVQVTNSPIAPGLSASGITKITVIVRSLVGCSEQKTYEATSSDLPSAFVDGSSESPNPVRSMDAYAYASYSSDDDDFSQPLGSDAHRELGGGPAPTQAGGPARSQPAVQVRTLVPNEHIQIRLRYVATKISIRRVAGYLSFAIRIPDEVVQKKSAVSSLQLCLSGCPSDERIAYKEVLSDPDTFVPRLGLKHPAMPRQEAIEICRDAGAVDFYFDSCVFDLVTSGDPGFSLAAVRAQTDVRTLYPIYRRHYETNRTSLDIYDNFAAGSSFADGGLNGPTNYGYTGGYGPADILDSGDRRRMMYTDLPATKGVCGVALGGKDRAVLMIILTQLVTLIFWALGSAPVQIDALIGGAR